MNLFEQHLRLSDLAALIDQTLYNKFGPNTFWVKAETSDIKNYYDRQYCFLSLVEKEGSTILAKMDAVIWRQQYGIIKKFTENTGVSFDKNISLLMRVQVGFNAQYGLRLQVLELDSGFTLGAIELQRQAVLTRLVTDFPAVVKLVDGQYFTQNQRLKLPLVVQKIALITAPGSDGERDFKHELENNVFGYKIEVDSYLTQIQGKDADVAILKQLSLIEELHKPYDLVAIVRGGGSQLDFSAFDTFDLGLKIAQFNTPIITGIGHERNVSIADLMSFSTLKTPTKAASFIVEYNANFERNIESFKSTLLSVTDDVIRLSKNNIERKALALKNASLIYLKDRQSSLNEMAISIKHLNPDNVLARGYAMLLKNNEVIIATNTLKPGEQIEAKTKNAMLNLTVNAVEPVGD